jgi:hypothetical protein
VKLIFSKFFWIAKNLWCKKLLLHYQLFYIIGQQTSFEEALICSCELNAAQNNFEE